MRLLRSVGAIALGMAAGQSAQVTACPSLALARQALQQGSPAPPEGCRTFVIRREGADNGEICVVNLAPADQGVLGDVLDSAVQTRWWAACAALSVP